MKHPACYIILFVVVLLASCGADRDDVRLLQQADSLLNVRLDSMKVVLDTWADSIGHCPERVRMYYNLLRVKADDKAYVTHTSDSLILSIVRYYREQRDKTHLPEALYYAGRTYSDLKDAPRALEYYQRAIDVMEHEELTDYNLLSRIYSQMGTLFFYQELYDELPDVLRKAYQCDLILKDSANLVFDLRDIGRSFAAVERQDSADWYYRRAIAMAQQIKNDVLRNMLYREFAGFCIKLGKYAEAYEMLQIGRTTIDSLGLPPFYANMARYYYCANRLDSAAYYYEKELASNSLLHKAGAYESLANIAHRQGNDAKAWSLLQQHVLYKDSLQNIIRTETMNKIDALYNYKKYEQENKELKSKELQRKFLLFLSLSLTLIVLLLGIVLWQKYKRREQELLLRQEKLKRMQREQYQFSQSQLAANKKKIEELVTQLYDAKKSNNLLQQNLLQAQKDLLEKENLQIKAAQTFRESSLMSLQQTNVWKKLHRLGEENEATKLTEVDWEELTKAIHVVYPQFVQRLNELCSLSPTEFQVCLLIKLDIPLVRIADIVCRSKQGISSLRERLYKKFVGKKGRPKDCDDFIRNL